VSHWPEYIAPEQNIILFDGVCVLCTGWVKFLLKYDKQQHYKLASVQSPAGQDLLRYAELPTEIFETLVVIEQGVIHVRSNAVLRVLRRLGLPWSLVGVFRVVPRLLRDFIYYHIAINRYRIFGQHSSCYVAIQADMNRFLKKPETSRV